MPAPLAVDREAVKAHAITHGVREAARAFGLAEGTVQYWSMAGKWLKDAGKTVVVQELPKSMKPRSTGSTVTASQAALATVGKHGQKGRLYAAKAVYKGMKHLAKQDGASILAQASDAASLGKLAVTAKLPGWADSDGQASIRLELIAQSAAQPVLDVEAEVVGPVLDSQDQAS